MTTVLLRIKAPSGDVNDLPLAISTTDRGYALELEPPGIGPLYVRGPDQFECLLHLREELEPLGYRTLVNGARRNVWPSGMARDMGTGRKAYLLTLGQHGQRPPMVDIFEPAEEVDIVSVAEQRAFFKKWMAEINPAAANYVDPEWHPSTESAYPSGSAAGRGQDRKPDGWDSWSYDRRRIWRLQVQTERWEVIAFTARQVALEQATEAAKRSGTGTPTVADIDHEIARRLPWLRKTNHPDVK